MVNNKSEIVQWTVDVYECMCVYFLSLLVLGCRVGIAIIFTFSRDFGTWIKKRTVNDQYQISTIN